MNDSPEKDTKRVSKAIIQHDGKVLLLLPKNKKNWHLPGGHIKASETFAQGIRREVHEETGLKVVGIKSIYKMHNFELFHCKCNASVVRISDEHIEYKWISPQQAMKKMQLTRETQRDLIESINKNVLKRDVVVAVKPKKKPVVDVEKENEQDK
jgi:ADP-ribose pyrophosphatase YjhB (NUDIX family)